VSGNTSEIGDAGGGHKRVAGQEWLVTRNDAQIHIPDVFEEVVREVEAVSLNSLQYVVLINPYNI